MAVPYFYDPIGDTLPIIPVDFQEYKGEGLVSDKENLAYLAECLMGEFPEAQTG